MKTKARKHLHVYLSIFFAVQIPLAIAWQLVSPETFERFWKQYLIFLSVYAIVVSHWAGASAETPTEKD